MKDQWTGFSLGELAVSRSSQRNEVCLSFITRSCTTYDDSKNNHEDTVPRGVQKSTATSGQQHKQDPQKQEFRSRSSRLPRLMEQRLPEGSS